jgi:hypothetical protein
MRLGVGFEPQAQRIRAFFADDADNPTSGEAGVAGGADVSGAMPGRISNTPGRNVRSAARSLRRRATLVDSQGSFELLAGLQPGGFGLFGGTRQLRLLLQKLAQRMACIV